MSRFVLTMIALCSLIGCSIVSGAQSATAPKSESSVSQQPQLLRTVKGQVLTSKNLPAVKLEFDNSFKYVGGQSFILYDVARAEQHFFVDADKEGRVKRLYWVQFEGYLPNNTHAYKYQANEVIQMGGLSFIADSMARKIKSGEGRTDSDGSRAQAFLESRGYRLEDSDVVLQRLVHLIDEAKRNELMIIYVESLSGTGVAAADLAPSGAAANRWQEMKKGLLERAVKGMNITR